MSCSNNKAEINTLSRREKKAGWILLFDGKTILEWKLFKGGEVQGWNIKDGILCNSGVGSDYGGDIITKDIFKDFELYLEWRIDSGSNSGVFYHVEELDSVRRISESGPEYQLLDDFSYLARAELDQLSGANYGMEGTQNTNIKPVGYWNKTRIVVQGSHVEHWLNDVKVVEYKLWSKKWWKQKNSGKWKNSKFYGMSKEGHIGLQDHGGLTCFRNIKIRRL